MANRRSNRLRGYDYSRPGAYFVTICTQNKKCLFGNIIDEKIILNAAGRVVEKYCQEIPSRFPDVKLDIFCIMPNHFHGIVEITNTAVGTIHELSLHAPPAQMTVKQKQNMLLPKIIGRFKMQSAKQINQLRLSPGKKLWQRSYYEHIIRNRNDFNRIAEYIKSNPKLWDLDSLNPENEFNNPLR